MHHYDTIGPEVPHKVHWDDMLLKVFTSKERCPALLAPAKGTLKILWVPLLPNGTGEAQV